MSEEQDLISVIVPIYKVEKYLEKCLHTITNQSYRNLEIILVDDGSPDNCPKMCDDWAKKDKRIKVIHKQNGGLMAAWMDGVQLSTGKYIQFTDSDDYLEFNAIEKLYSALKENNADMSICSMNVVFDKKTLVKKPFKSENILGFFEGEELEKIKVKAVENVNEFLGLYRTNKLFKREHIINNLKYCDTRIALSEDTCITLAAVLDCKSIVIIEDCLYNYVQRSTSIIKSYNKKILEHSEYLVAKLTELITDKNYYSDKAIIFEQTRSLFLATRNFLNSTLTKKEKKEIYNQLLSCPFALNIIECKDRSFLPKTFKMFLKVFLSKNFFIMNLAIKTLNFIKKLKGVQ